MSFIKRAGDLIYTFRFLKLLTTPFKKTVAYDLGIIDEKGNRLVKDLSSEQKDAYTPFHRLVFNIKKLVDKAPGGNIASYAAALYLIKEKYNVDLSKIDIEPSTISEANNSWYQDDDGSIYPGIYKVMYEKVLNTTQDDLVKPGDKVKIEHNTYPVGDVFGIEIYEAIHVKTGQKIYVTSGELKR